MSVYDYTVMMRDGSKKPLSDYAGKVLLIVNTASRCGFTGQYSQLQELYGKYRAKGFEVLAFPCNQFLNQEPLSDEETGAFCRLNFGVEFTVFAKIDVRGKNAAPLFRYLTEKSPGWFFKAVKWNFTKFLVDRKGEVRGRYAPATNPLELEKEINLLLG